MATCLDFETRSVANLKECGSHVYAAHPSTSVWCMAYRVDDGPVQLWTPEMPYPHEMTPPFNAWNAQFERLIWKHVMEKYYGFPAVPLEDWFCTMARSRAVGLPGSLEAAAKVLKVGEKDMEGRRLMLQMEKPRSVKGGRVIWWTDRDRMERLFDYCRQDVVVESAIGRVLPHLSPFERRVWLVDQKVNDRGVALDRGLITGANNIVRVETARVNERLFAVTGGMVDAVTNHGAILQFVKSRGVDTDTVARAYLQELVANRGAPDDVLEVAELRLSAGKSSTAKLKALEGYAGEDGRVRGMLVYHGAGPGRWSGFGPQPQNFPRGEDGLGSDDEALVELVRAGDAESVEMVYGSPMVAVSSILRGCFVAAPGMDLIAADYVAIEARVLAWIADQHDLLQSFFEGRNVYAQMASAIYGVPPEDIQKGTPEYQLGKIVVLGAGYQMGAATFMEHAAKYGVFLSEERSKQVIGIYRRLNDCIKEFWFDINRAAIRAVETGEPCRVGRVSLRKVERYLWLVLPSGRLIGYPNPKLRFRETEWGRRASVQVWGVDSMTRQWCPYWLYGGILTENVVQATARDLLAHAFVQLEESGYHPILTVHDEIVCEEPEGTMSAPDLEAIMCDIPEWAEGCPVAAEGWSGKRYRK